MENLIRSTEPLVVATHNLGKVREFKKLFSPYKINIIFSGELGIKEPEETGKTFQDNSVIKAKSALNLGFNVLADDSGLCVKALNNEPGIYSARWAKKHGGWKGAMGKIYNELINNECKDFSAKYHCCLTLAWKDGKINSYSGEIHGEIAWPIRGEKGFGYDPIFIPKGYDITFGEMDKKKKMLIDHRFKAFKKIIKNHMFDATGQL